MMFYGTGVGPIAGGAQVASGSGMPAPVGNYASGPAGGPVPQQQAAPQYVPQGVPVGGGGGAPGGGGGPMMYRHPDGYVVYGPGGYDMPPSGPQGYR